jgi:hypothetical protein
MSLSREGAWAMQKTTTFRPHQSEPAIGAKLAEELDCLARFLDANADERTMEPPWR